MLKKSLALLALLLLTLIQAAPTTDTKKPPKTKPLPHLHKFRASSWDKHLYEYIHDHDYLCEQQIGVDDSMTMEFENPISTPKLKKYLRIRNEITDRSISFSTLQLNPKQFKITFPTPLKKDCTYRISLPDMNMFFRTPPTVFSFLFSETFGESLGREVKIEAIIYSPLLLPRISPLFENHGNTLSMKLTNIKHIDYTVFTFKNNILNYLTGRKNNRRVNDDLAPYIDSQETHSYITDTFGHTQKKTALPGRTKNTTGMFGVRVNRYEPGTTYYLKDFHNYLLDRWIPEHRSERRHYNSPQKDKLTMQPLPGSLMLFHNTDIEFLVRSDGKNAYLWVYKGNDAPKAALKIELKSDSPKNIDQNTVTGVSGSSNLYRLKYPGAPVPAKWIQHNYSHRCKPVPDYGYCRPTDLFLYRREPGKQRSQPVRCRSLISQNRQHTP